MSSVGWRDRCALPGQSERCFDSHQFGDWFEVVVGLAKAERLPSLPLLTRSQQKGRTLGSSIEAPRLSCCRRYEGEILLETAQAH